MGHVDLGSLSIVGGTGSGVQTGGQTDEMVLAMAPWQVWLLTAGRGPQRCLAGLAIEAGFVLEQGHHRVGTALGVLQSRGYGVPFFS